MVDLQKTRRDGTSPVVILMITLVVAVLLGGGYLVYRLSQHWMTAAAAKEALDVRGMAFTRRQAMARVSLQEPGASLFDWTDTGTSPAGLTCSVMNRGDMQTGRAWTICGVGDRIVRISVGQRQGVIDPRSQQAADTMRRMVEVVAPEATYAEKDAAVSNLYYFWGRRGGADIAGASIRFSTDSQGGLTRITATPAV